MALATIQSAGIDNASAWAVVTCDEGGSLGIQRDDALQLGRAVHDVGKASQQQVIFSGASVPGKIREFINSFIQQVHRARP